MMIVTKFPTFLLRSSHSGRKFIEGRAPLASFDGWRGRSTAGPTSLPPGVLSFRSETREALAVKRREFITLLGGATAWPLAARAQQQPAKLPTIGFLGAATPAAWSVFIVAFVRRLRELGWIEGRTIAIEYRWAEGRGERYAEIAAEFVRLKVDIIVTSGGAVL